MTEALRDRILAKLEQNPNNAWTVEPLAKALNVPFRKVERELAMLVYHKLIRQGRHEEHNIYAALPRS